MTSTDELYRRLRDADPATGLEADADSPRARRLMDQARLGFQPSPTRSRRSAMVAALVAVFMVVSTAALATGMFQPDPSDVATILDDAEQAAEVHLPGWRPVLTAESVWCHYQEGQSINTFASEFPLDQRLTRDELTAECLTGNDLARTLTDPPAAATLCAATIPSTAYAERLELRGERLLAGDLSKATPIVPVVLGWETSCEQAHVDTTPEMSLTTLTDGHLDEINEVREVEISLRAIAMERCLDRQQAVELGRQVADRLAGEWPLIAMPDEAFTPDCYQVWVYEWGVLRLEGRI